MASSSSQISPTLFITILVLLLYPLCSVADTGSSPSPSPSPPPATTSPSPSNFLSPPAPPSSDPSPDSPSPAPAPSPASGTDEKKSPPAPAPAVQGNVGHENQPNADLQSNETSSGGMSGRQKAGIAVGVIASVLIVGIGGFIYKKRQQNLRRSQFGYDARREYL